MKNEKTLEQEILSLIWFKTLLCCKIQNHNFRQQNLHDQGRYGGRKVGRGQQR